MIPRTSAPKLREAARRFPVVTLTRLRQSGKTTLARAVFKNHAYVSLKLSDQQAFALEDWPATSLRTFITDSASAGDLPAPRRWSTAATKPSNAAAWSSIRGPRQFGRVFFGL